jgi:hypothetical protein
MTPTKENESEEEEANVIKLAQTTTHQNRTNGHDAWQNDESKKSSSTLAQPLTS